MTAKEIIKKLNWLKFIFLQLMRI